MSSFEFIISGPPVSQQSRQRQGLHEWKDLVREEAERLWNPSLTPSNASLRFAITYYYGDIPVDTEDIVKPIMDALIGLVYNDNSQITEITQSRQDLYGSFRIPNLSPTLAAGFGRGREFLHVQIDGFESFEELASQAQESATDKLEQLQELEPPADETKDPGEGDFAGVGSQEGQDR
ncbi:MAG: hypothetical protein JXA78_17895 [Anaerolineales bacterium]|nr:hypothetical protein [Anaerolineales bacterium]